VLSAATAAANGTAAGPGSGWHSGPSLLSPLQRHESPYLALLLPQHGHVLSRELRLVTSSESYLGRIMLGRQAAFLFFFLFTPTLVFASDHNI
jgi:hypothetical protein